MKVQGGLVINIYAANNYIPDFEPTHKFSRGSYDNSEAREQRRLSMALGRKAYGSTRLLGHRPEEAHEYQKGERSTRCTLHNTHKIGAGFVIYALFEGGDAMIS